MRIVILVVLLFGASISLCQNTWTNGSLDDQWATAGNWSFGYVPVASEAVLINNGDHVFISGGVSAVASNIVLNNSTILEVRATASLVVDGSLDAATDDGIEIYNGADLVNDGTTIVVNAETSGIELGSGTSILNSGTLTISEFGSETGYDAGIHMFGAGVREIENSGDLNFINNIVADVGAGIYADPSVTGLTITNFVNGVVDIESTNASLTAGINLYLGTLSNEGRIDSDINAPSGTDIQLQGSFSDFSNSGTINLLSDSGNGLFSNSVGATFLNDGDITVTGQKATSTIVFSNGVFTNEGTINLDFVAADGLRVNSASAQFINDLTGQITIDSPSASSGRGILNFGDFSNAGVLTINGFSGVNGFGIRNESGGTVNLSNQTTISDIGNTGILSFGALNTATGSALELMDCDTGIAMLNAGSILTNQGDIDISGTSVYGIRLRGLSQLANTTGSTLGISISSGVNAAIRTEGGSVLTNMGEILIDSVPGYGFDASGTVTNFFEITVFNTNNGFYLEGLLTNESGGVIDCNGTSSSSDFQLQATGELVNHGDINIFNSTCSSSISSSGTVTNTGTIDDDGGSATSISNSSDFTNSATGRIEIEGVARGISHTGGDFLNEGLILLSDLSNSGIWNNSDFTNEADILIDQLGFSRIEEGFENSNNGVFSNNGLLDMSNVEIGILNNNEISNGDRIIIFDSFTGVRNWTAGDLFSNNGLLDIDMSRDFGVLNYGQVDNSGDVEISENLLTAYQEGGTTINNANIDLDQVATGLFIETAGDFNTELGSLSISNAVHGSPTAVISNNGTFFGDLGLDITTVSNGGRGIYNTGDFTIGGGLGANLMSMDNQAVYNLGGTFTVNGSLSVQTTPIAFDEFRNTASGIIRGGGVIDVALLENIGTISPGNSPGQLTIVGDLDSSVASSTIVVEIDGNAGVGINPNGHDQIVVDGTTTLGAGTIRTLTNGFTPGDFDCYTVIDSNTLIGTFATEDQPDYTFDVSYNSPASGEVEVCGISILAVELLSFNVAYAFTNKQSLITWTSESEINHDYYDVQFSKDGISWQSVTRVIGLGDNSDYEATHQEPIPNAEGKLYYRLRLVDNSASESFSEIKVIDIPINQDVLIWPNPLKSGGELFVEGIEVKSMEIYDLQGRLLGNTLGAASRLQPGAYLLVINKELRRQIIVQ